MKAATGQNQKSFSDVKDGNNSIEDKLILANLMDYSPMTDLNIVDRRSLIRYEFSRQTYTNGEPMECRFGSSDCYIYGRNCYLSFSIRIPAGGGGDGGTRLSVKAGAIAPFLHCDYKSSSGAEIDNLQHVNVHYAMSEPYKNKQNFKLKGAATLIHPPAAQQFDGQVLVDFCVPLELLCPIFGYEGLLPSLGLTSSSVLKFILAQPDEVFQQSGVAVTRYEIVNPVLMVDQFILNDSIQRRLNEMSSRRGPGLAITWDSWYHQSAQTNVTSLELQMQNSVSRAHRAWACCRATVQGSEGGDDFDSVNSVSEYIYRLGSLRFPDQTVTRRTEAYANTLRAFDKYVNGVECDVSFVEYNNNFPIVATGFSRSTCLNLSGYAVNSDRRLRLALTKTGAEVRRYDMFLEYKRYANIHLDLISVKA